MDSQEIIPAELVDLLPLQTTRAETALSRFPIHNLTKSEKIDIRIVQKGEGGETDIYWSVSPSRDFGEPRQLAYKLDTLLITSLWKGRLPALMSSAATCGNYSGASRT